MPSLAGWEINFDDCVITGGGGNAQALLTQRKKGNGAIILFKTGLLLKVIGKINHFHKHATRFQSFIVLYSALRSSRGLCF